MTGLVKAIGASNAVDTVPIPGGEKQLSAQGRPLLMQRAKYLRPFCSDVCDSLKCIKKYEYFLKVTARSEHVLVILKKEMLAVDSSNELNRPAGPIPTSFYGHPRFPLAPRQDVPRAPHHHLLSEAGNGEKQSSAYKCNILQCRKMSLLHMTCDDLMMIQHLATRLFGL